MDSSVRIELDHTANAAYVALSDNNVARTCQVTDLVLVDLDDMNVVVGIEVLALNAEIPFNRLAAEFHVRSQVIEILRTIRPDVGSFVANISSRAAGSSSFVAPRTVSHPVAP